MKKKVYVLWSDGYDLDGVETFGDRAAAAGWVNERRRLSRRHGASGGTGPPFRVEKVIEGVELELAEETVATEWAIREKGG